MMNTKNRILIATGTFLLVALIAVSFVALPEAALAPNFRNNLNTDRGTVVNHAPWSTSANSAYQQALNEYGGNLMSEENEWWSYLSNTGERNGFTGGPAPDRPDVLWRSDDLAWAQPVMTSSGLRTPSVSAAQIAFNGKLFFVATLYPYGNTTSRSFLMAVNPLTGQEIWRYDLSSNGVTVTGSFGASNLFKLTDNLIMARAGGLSVWNANTGEKLWTDPTITPNAVYHPMVVRYNDNGDAVACFGPRNLPNYRVPVEGGWSLADPATPKENGTRLMWDYPMDEPGNPQLCYGDGKVFMGSYSAYRIYALDATTGEKLWETARPDAAGYSAAYANGKVYVGCQSQSEIAYDANTGAVVWVNNDGVANRAFNVWNVGVAYGRVYFHDLGAGTTGATKCYDAATGEKLWASPTFEYIGYYQTAIADGKIYGQQSDGSVTTGREAAPLRFSCWDAYTGKEIWSLQMNIAWPSISYGCLYINSGGVLYCMSTAYAPQDWSMWRGNVDMPGVTSDVGPLNLAPGPIWTYRTGAGILGSPVVSNGKMYINSNDRYVYCLDAYTGAKIWEFQTAVPEMTTFGSTPAIVGDRLIVGPDDGNLYCLNANTGAKIWQLNMGTYKPFGVSLGEWNGRASPIIYNNRIYIGSLHDNTTYCVNMDGSVAWKFKTGGEIISSTAIEDGVAYVLTYGNSGGSFNELGEDDTNFCYEFDANTGALIRSFPVQNRYPRVAGGSFGASFLNSPAHTPVVVGDTIYMGVDTANIAAYYTNGTLKFAAEQLFVLGENTVGSCLYVPDSYLPEVFGQGYDIAGQPPQQSGRLTNIGGKLFSEAGPTTACMRADNGTSIWSAWGGWAVWSSVIFSGVSTSSKIYCGSESYSMTTWNASTGTPLSWYTTEGNVPGSAAVWDGRLYFGSADGNVYCFADYVTQNMAISQSLSSTQINSGQSITVTATLTRPQNPDTELTDLHPPLPNAPIIVTFTRPGGTEVNREATTDFYGTASVTYTPDVAGEWKVIAWYNGEMNPTFEYSYAFSDETIVQVAGASPTPTATVAPTTAPPTTAPTTAPPTTAPTTAPPTTAPTTAPPVTSSPTETATTDNTMTYVYVAVAVIVIVVIAAAALMLMRRKK